MTKKELIKQLQEFDDEDKVWIHHKLQGKIMPEEIIAPVRKVEYTADGILLKTK